jgi:outer membrane protein assembly complex protein YaeT
MNLLRTSLILMLTALSAVAETRVRITGTKQKSENEILDLMGGRLAHVRANEAAPSRADDAAFLVRQVLRKDGYTDVRVDWKIVGRGEIVLTVHEGGRLSLGRVRVNGVPPAEAEKLAKLYARPARKGHSFTSGAAPFREEDAETGLSYLRQELNAQGYWGGEAAVTNRTTDPASGAVDLTIDVRPGPLYSISEAKIVSRDGRGMPEAQAAAKPYAGKTATTGNLNAMRLAVEEVFVSSGYPDAEISMTRTLDAPRFVPEFFINLGKRVRLNRIDVEGLVRTNPKRIEARLKSLEGDWYDEAAMNKRLRGFLAIGAFSSARLETREIAGDRIDATLHLEEARAKEISFAAGGDSYLGALLRTTYTDRNLMGELLGFSAGFEFSSRGVLGEARLVDPWFMGTDVAASARVYALVYGREGYSTFETGLEGTGTWEFGDHYKLEALAGFSFVNLTEDGLPVSELGETVYGQPRLRVTQTLDYRDSAVLPRNGWHLTAPLEIGSAMGDLSTSYVQAELSGAWYHTFENDWQIVLGGAGGILMPSGDGVDLPINLRLFNGGARSVRSFPERELGPTVEGYPTGGEGVWHANVELIRRLAGSLKAVGFVDAGSLSREFDKLGSGDVELAVGLGLRLDLPIGPVRLEYGYNLTRDPGDPVGTLHFAIGVAF